MREIGGLRLTPHAIEARLEARREIDAMIAEAERIYSEIDRQFSVPMAEAVVRCFDQTLADLAPHARAVLLAWVGGARAGRAPTPLWVAARLLGLLGEAGSACARWDACIEALPRTEAEALLHRARARVGAGQWEGAVADVRLALRESASYEFWQRTESVVRKVLAAHVPSSRRSLKLAVLAGKSSISLLVPLLKLACLRDEIDATIYASDYDALFGEALDEASGLHAFAPDVVILASHWRDAELPPFASDPEAVAREVTARFSHLWGALRSRGRPTIVAHAFDRPARDPYGRLATALPGGRGAVLEEINARLRAEAGNGVILLDLDAVAAKVGAAAWEDARQWHIAKQHPGTGGLLELVEHHMAIVRATLGLTKKVLVLDLDNLLWGGVIGEEGLERIDLGPPSSAGEAYQDLQRYAKRLKERGVLLAVCSKNNEADARLPFESHPETVLELSDFVGFLANWQDKATNLRQLAGDLSLGLDSFVFLDDNPVERQWVRGQIPELTVPELPADPSRYVETLDRGRYFEAITISAEDRARHEQYRGNVERQQLEARSGSMEDFLRELGMVAESGPIDEPNLKRVAQLVNKTNQFNLTTRRYTEAQLGEQARDPRWWTRWFRLSDRYGDNGLIGILTLKPRSGDPGAKEIDNWLISCRVLGRRMDAFMLRAALEHCSALGLERLYGRYLPTAKNGQVADLLPRFGFTLGTEEKGAGDYVLDVASAVLPEIPIASRDGSA